MNSHAAFSEDATPPARESHQPTDSKGWDGKLRVDDSRAALLDPEAPSDDHSPSDDSVPPVIQIAADEGECCCYNCLVSYY
jgi:hypothetical protein